MRDLQAAIKRSCPARVWSQGVKLARADAVAGESADDEEIVVRVKAPGRAVALTVVLYPGDLEWECDGPSCDDTCSHVVAAVLAVSKAHKAGAALPTSAAVGGKVCYRFRRQDGGLALDRVVVEGSDEHRLRSTLGALTSGREPGPPVSPEAVDLQVDRILGTRLRGAVSSTTLHNLLIALADHPRVQLDGTDIRVSSDRVLPHAVVRNRSGGVRVTIERAAAISDVLAPGVVRCGDALHLLDETELTGVMLERLPLVHDFERARLGELRTSFLPELARRIDIDDRTRNLPKLSSDMRPRIDIRLDQDGRRLQVLPTLVYGDPPCARVDGDRLVHLSGPVPIRDRTAEKRVLARLLDKLSLKPGRTVVYENQAAVRFMQQLRAYRGLAAQTRSSDSGMPVYALVPRLTIDGDRFELYFETEAADGGSSAAGTTGEGRPDGIGRRIEAEAVLSAWRDGMELLVIDSPGAAGWAQLPGDWLQRFGHRVADLLAARDPEGRAATHAVFDLARLCADLDHPPPPGLSELAPLFNDFETLPAPALPADLGAQLRPYQRVGVAWLGFLRNAGLGAVLADDMGLGKTLQALCAVRGRTLVVCPTSVLHNWADEARRFRPSLRVHVYHGPKRTLPENADLLLTSYAILRLDIEQLEAIAWDAVILDEAQAIKNPDSQAARAAYRLRAEFRLSLSGTPVENRLDELWSQMHFTNRGLLGGRARFKKRYAEPIGRGDQGAAKELRTRLRPFLLRRLKRDVAKELPPRTDMVLRCALTAEERDIYDAVRAATRADVVQRLAQGGGVMAALEALLRLRQASCHPGLLPGHQDQSERISAKLQSLLDALELVAADDHKALVFSQWTSLLDLIEPWLQRSGIDWLRLDGSTRDRASVVRGFQAEDGPPVLLISLKAGGTGLNLTAADHVFLCDPWWNPAVEDQAADRAHRIGQERPVMVYRLVAQDTVEERILALQDKKRALADAALDGADRAARLTRDDLLALLE